LASNEVEENLVAVNSGIVGDSVGSGEGVDFISAWWVPTAVIEPSVDFLAFESSLGLVLHPFSMIVKTFLVFGSQGGDRKVWGQA